MSPAVFFAPLPTLAPPLTLTRFGRFAMLIWAAHARAGPAPASVFSAICRKSSAAKVSGRALPLCWRRRLRPSLPLDREPAVLRKLHCSSRTTVTHRQHAPTAGVAQAHLIRVACARVGWFYLAVKLPPTADQQQACSALRREFTCVRCKTWHFGCEAPAGRVVAEEPRVTSAAAATRHGALPLPPLRQTMLP